MERKKINTNISEKEIKRFAWRKGEGMDHKQSCSLFDDSGVCAGICDCGYEESLLERIKELEKEVEELNEELYDYQFPGGTNKPFTYPVGRSMY